MKSSLSNMVIGQCCSQVLSLPPSERTLGAAGHVSPRIWEITKNKLRKAWAQVQFLFQVLLDEQEETFLKKHLQFVALTDIIRLH